MAGVVWRRGTCSRRNRRSWRGCRRGGTRTSTAAAADSCGPGGLRTNRLWLGPSSCMIGRGSWEGRQWHTKSSGSPMTARSTPTVMSWSHRTSGRTTWEGKYRDRALRIRVDDDGLEYLEINGKASERTRKGSLGIMGAMGSENLKPSPDRRYADSMPLGACDAADRLKLMDQENLVCSLLYPTIGLLWEVEETDPEISLAYARGLQPLDRRFLSRQRRPAGAHRHADPSRSRRLRARTRARRARRLQGRVGQPVQPQPGDPRPSGP